MIARRPIDRVLRRVRAFSHQHAVRHILKTPPITPGPERVVLFSMIGTPRVLPYLVAIKSLHRALGVGRVAILDDGTLTAADRRLLAVQCGNPDIYSIHDVSTGPCPQGGTWERLLTLLELTRDDYVVQVDSDTLTKGPVPEVGAAIAANRTFTLLGDARAGEVGILTLPEFARIYGQGGTALDRPHDQTPLALERAWDRYPDQQARYVRGSSGFAGFARGEHRRAAAELFSQRAEQIVGRERWCKWGSEQITSNFLVANSADPVLLPYDRYLNYMEGALDRSMAFLHFFGTHRFATWAYERESRRVIAALR